MALGRRTPSLSDELEALRQQAQHIRGTLPDRIDVDAEGVEQGLAQLVLTLIEFVRQVLERQAVRRMEGGSLSEEEVERVGLALSASWKVSWQCMRMSHPRPFHMYHLYHPSHQHRDRGRVRG